MSNRLTFSLASLILIFALAFAAMPVMGAAGGPTVEITPYTGKNGDDTTYTATRADLRFKVEFSHTVGGTGDEEFAADDVTALKAISRNDPFDTTGTAASVTLVAEGTGATNVPDDTLTAGKVFVITVNLNDSAYDMGYLKVDIKEDAAKGNSGANTGLSQAASYETSSLPKANDWTVTAAIGEDKPEIKTGKLIVDDTGTADVTEGTFTVTLTLSGGTGDIPNLTTADNAAQVQIEDADGDPVTTISAATPTQVGLVATVTYTVGTATDVPVFVGINPQWANGNRLRIPAKMVTTPDPTEIAPTVDIELIPGSLDEAATTFQVKFTFEKAMAGDGETAGDVPSELMSTDITIEKEVVDSTDPTMMMMVDSDAYVSDIIMLSAGKWVATVNYQFESDGLPLYVGTSADVSAINGIVQADLPADAPRTTLKVGADDPTDPVVPADAPGKPDAPMAAKNDTNDLIIDVSWTAPTDTGGSAITGYVLTKYDADGDVVKTFPEAPAADSLLPADSTSYEVGPVPGADRGMSFTFTVTAWNDSGGGAESDMSAAYTVPMAPMVTDTMNPIVQITVLSHVNGKHTVDAAGTVRFDLLFSEELAKGTSISRLQAADFFVTRNGVIQQVPETALSAAMPTTMPATTAPSGNQERYILTLTAGTDPQEIEIELLGLNVLGGQVADPSGNALVKPATSKFDTIPPDVRISVVGATAVSGTPFTFSGEPMDKLTFRFDFTEALSPAFTTTDIHRSGADNFTLLADSAVQPVPGVENAYTVIASILDHNAETFLSIKRLEVSDAAKNQLQNDRYATYSPTTTAPVATITAPDIFNCGIAGNDVTVTIADSEGIASGQGIAASEITISTGWQIATGSFRATAGATSATATFNVVRKDVENGADRSWLGIQEVTVTVAADAVKDDTNLGNAAKSDTNTAGPVITVPAGQYVVVLRDNAWRTSHLNFVRTLFLGDYNVRAQNIQVQAWDCMPDLGLIFDVTVDASPGIGGGGLMVLQSRDHDTTKPIAKGTVGISEIMWSEDRGLPFGATSNLQHAREQWIELHNTNSFDVKVTLFELIRTEAYRTNDASRAGLIDVMSNYDIGGRWDVQEKNDDGTPKYGTDGNSEFGHDFVSMKRVAPAADKNYAHGEKQGRNKGHWSASTSIYYTKRAGLAGTGQIPLDDLNYHFVGSPGRANTFSAPGPITRTNLPKNLIFNEVSNRRDQTLEWIELKNVSDAEINLKRYVISLVTAKGTDTKFYEFPDNDNIKLAAGEILLLLDTDPRDNDAHPLEVAFNRDAGNDQGLGIGPNAIKYKVANFAEGGLPDDGKFVLLLRGHKGVEKLKTHERVIDAIGYDDNLGDTAIHTNLWPLKYFNGALDARNMIAVETVHRRQHRIDPDKNTHGDDKDEHQALRDVGYTGIGYKRHAQRIAAHGGTPGHEDTRKNENPQITAPGNLTISEIMYAQGDGQFPQWIEIYNSSETDPVNLHAGDHGWRLIIENFDDGEIPVKRLSGTLNFRSSDVQTILPGQTVMIASTRARNSGSAFFDTRVVFPATRVFSVWDDARGEFDMKRSTDPILSEKGFYIELIDGKNNFVDGVGNLVKSPNRRAAQDIVWELSTVAGGMMEEDGRSSILRRYREYKDGELVGAYTADEVEMMGVEAAGWISAHMTDFLDVRQTWFGHPDDYGSPGITGGRVLPVSLSKFRPERLDSGEIVIRWITESELNNAGFNILRSEKSDAEFKQINTKLIAGQGTTSEKTTYEWKDTTAKPNVVYYYQIQDVSLDGQVQTLRMSRLKGNVSAEGKLTTTWGELKALQ